MAYTTYITNAIVCGSKSSNTADRSFLLFTREAGMLYATAKSVREERSKQRFSLQEFSYLCVTLVHGKAGWRITGTEPIENMYGAKDTRLARTVIRNTVRLLRRLLQGESAHPALFDDVLTFLRQSEYNEYAEEAMTLRVLHFLGYLAPTSEIEALLGAPSIAEGSKTLHGDGSESRKALIEAALRESHL